MTLFLPLNPLQCACELTEWAGRLLVACLLARLLVTFHFPQFQQRKPENEVTEDHRIQSSGGYMSVAYRSMTMPPLDLGFVFFAPFFLRLRGCGLGYSIGYSLTWLAWLVGCSARGIVRTPCQTPPPRQVFNCSTTLSTALDPSQHLQHLPNPLSPSPLTSQHPPTSHQ